MEEGYKTAFTKDPILLTRNHTHRVTKILEMLLIGMPIKLGGYTIRLAEDIEGWLLPVIVNDEKEKLVMGFPDMSIQWVSTEAMKIPQEQYDKLLLEYTLTKTKFSRLKKRRT